MLSVRDEAMKPRNAANRIALDHALHAAKRFWAETGDEPTDATWSPHRAYLEAHARDEAVERLLARELRPTELTGGNHPAAVYQDLISTALVGEHVQHLSINLQEAAICWPQPATPEPLTAKTVRESGEDQLDRKAVAADADLTLQALERALQHALFLTFVRDAELALPGERRDLFDYCAGWPLRKAQINDVWSWLVHDVPQFGGRRVELAIDRTNRCVYRKPCTLWQKTYTLTASLWGGLVAFGLVAGTFALLDRAGITSWPEDWPIKMIVLFLFVAAGGGLHLASRSLSNIRFDDPLKVYTAAEGWDWLRLRWIAILRIYIPIAIVVGSLWGAGNVPTSFSEIGTAVLAGFTADSIFRTSLSAMQAQAAAAEPRASTSAST
jgi:hypothetical protein